MERNNNPHTGEIWKYFNFFDDFAIVSIKLWIKT